MDSLNVCLHSLCGVPYSPCLPGAGSAAEKVGGAAAGCSPAPAGAGPTATTPATEKTAAANAGKAQTTQTIHGKTPQRARESGPAREDHSPRSLDEALPAGPGGGGAPHRSL